MVNQGGYIITHLNLAGEVGGGRVLSFPKFDFEKQTTNAPLPKNANEENYFVVTLIGDSLECADPSVSIPSGRLLVIKRFGTFHEAEIFRRLCLIRIHNSEDFCHFLKKNKDGSFTVYGNNPKYKPEVFQASEIEVLGIVEMDFSDHSRTSKTFSSCEQNL